MANEVILQFNEFVKAMDTKIKESIGSKDLTEHISQIYWDLLNNYKEINGTSAGIHGFSEYIVFSAFKNYIEIQNTPQEFKYLRQFELEKNDKKLIIYRSSSLSHLPNDARTQLFSGDSKLRAPDIAILKKENGNYKLIAVIENKNYLDKGSTDSAIEILSQIRSRTKDNHTKYAIFSPNGIFVGGGTETRKKLKDFVDIENNFLIINESVMKGRKKSEFNGIDLSQFFDLIREEIELGRPY
jgi:hypothetical protein